MDDKRTMFYGATPEIFEKAKLLRLNMTRHEELLWKQLKSNKINGLRFKAQHPISTFIADFYCHKVQLVVELDGKSHSSKDQKEYDKNRTDALNQLGISVMRFSNEQIENNIRSVIAIIKEKCIALLIKNQPKQ